MYPLSGKLPFVTITITTELPLSFMNRFFFSFVLFFFPVTLFAQTAALLQIETVGNITRLGNGEIVVSWDSEQRVVLIDQGGLFARILIPNGKTSVVAKHPVAGRDGKQIAGASLVIQKDGDENGIEAIYTLAEQNPFVLISTIFSKEMFQDGVIRKLTFPQIELFLPEPADKLKTLGTAGLRAVDGHKGSYSFLAVANPENRNGVVAGWITHRKGSGVVFSDKNAESKVVISPVIEYGRLLPSVDPANPAANLSEVFVLGRFEDCRRGLERYAWQIARSHQIQMKEPPSGYCTWYADKFGGACNETELVRLTQAAAEKLVPYGFNFVQIDDGWQEGVTKNGPKKNFMQFNPQGAYRNGMKKTAQMIRSNNMRAGLWFMPFSGSSEDSYWDKNWFVKSGVTDILDERGHSKRRYAQTVNKLGEPYESFWGGTSLDLTNPDVQQYLHDEVRRIAGEWEFNYFKLDGLWTGLATEQLYINNEYCPDDLGEPVFHDPHLTPVAAYRKGFEIIRQAAGDDVFLLGCNVSQNMRTLGASFGCVDAMRIGPDNGAKWDSLKAGPWHGSNRYFLNGRVWWNDPDPVYVRDSIPLEHARLLASWVAVSGQLYAFSDWLPTLSEERIEILRRTIRSHGLRSARPVDLFNEDLPKIWHLTTRSWSSQNVSEQLSATAPAREIVAFYNWDDKNPTKIETTPSRLGLPEAKEYVAFDFWGNQFFGLFTDAVSVEIPPGSCLILAVRPVADHPILLSTSQHITQGIVDVIEETWDSETKTLSGVSRVIGGEPYELRIYDPAKKELRREVRKPTETLDSFPWN
ncbi:MAG: alpha-galactosidase, partial [Planctomycetaceae bacterium]|nr:alpha-galactosidase [Planctomycetaceae bacterium]